MNEFVLLIGAGPEQAYVARRIRGYGLGVLVTDRNPAAPGFAAADDHRVASTYDVEASIAAAREMAAGRRVTAVMAIGVDVPIVAAEVARALGCFHMPVEACALAMSKRTMQEFMAREGIPAARCMVVPADGPFPEPSRVFARLGSPVIVKPADSRGARGVRLVHDEAGVLPALEDAAPHSPSRTLLVEEFLDGPQISGESLLVEGKASTIGFFDRNYSRLAEFAPQVIEDGAEAGSIHASRRPEADRLVERIAAGLGIDRGIIKTDLVIHRGEMKVIEFALRMSGGYFGTCAVEASTGVDFLRAAVDVFRGGSPGLRIPNRERGAAIRFWFGPAGRLRRIRGWEELASRPGFVHAEAFFRPGQELPPIRSMVERRGVLVFRGETRAEAVRLADEAVASVEWELEP
jgi:biotin carboxylase